MENKTPAAQPLQVSAKQLGNLADEAWAIGEICTSPALCARAKSLSDKLHSMRAVLAAAPQRGEFLDLQLVEDALFMAAAVDTNSDRAERMRELGERIYKLKIGAPKATPPCKHCSHANPHDGPAGSVDDGCTEPGCNCGFYERAEVSPVAVEPQLSARDFWNQWWSQCKTAMLWHNWQQIAIQFAEAYASSSRVGKTEGK